MKNIEIKSIEIEIDYQTVRLNLEEARCLQGKLNDLLGVKKTHSVHASASDFLEEVEKANAARRAKEEASKRKGWIGDTIMTPLNMSNEELAS